MWFNGGREPYPGPSGWAELLRFRCHVRGLSGAEPVTTNNRVELTAAPEALEALSRPCLVALNFDGEYVRDGFTLWSTGWVRCNWSNASGDPVLNMDIWRRVLDATGRRIGPTTTQSGPSR